MTDPLIEKERLDLNAYLFAAGYEISQDFSGANFFDFRVRKKRR